MDNEHAKEIMKAYRDRLTSSCSNQLDSDIEAFNLAIKALEERENPISVQPEGFYIPVGNNGCTPV